MTCDDCQKKMGRILELEVALNRALELINHAKDDAFVNGNTDSTGSIDEGIVMAARIVRECNELLEIQWLK